MALLPFDIVFTDIDGTLLNKDRELSPRTIAVIQKLKDHVPFVLISARMPAAMRHLQRELHIDDQPLICYNGALTLVEGNAKTSKPISTDILTALLDFNRDLGVHLSLYQGENWHVPEYDYWARREENNTKVSPQVSDLDNVLNEWQNSGVGAHKIMAMGDEGHIEAIKNFLTSNFDNELHLYRSKPTYLEIANKSISKLSGIDDLLNDHFKLTRERSLAFGDNFNDVTMIDGVGYGVAVDNAKGTVKAVANHITHTGKNDGVAKSLEDIFRDFL